jgi:endonuclease-8
MPEGDTLFRTAAGLRPHLVGRVVTAARARVPGPQVERVVGATVTAVEAAGKNLLVRFDNGLELRTHLRMRGSWHRYRPGEPWRRPAGRAVLVLEVPGAVAACFDAPVVELLETRTESLHAPLAGLGPDATADAFDRGEALRRLREPSREALPVAEALLDQRALAGVGNVFKSEMLFIERVDPFARLGALDEATLGRLVDRARALLLANRASVARVTTGPAGGGPASALATGSPSPRAGRLWVYGRAGRPCRRCGAQVRSRRHGDLPRTTFWCPRCQAPGSSPEEARPCPTEPSMSAAAAREEAGCAWSGSARGHTRRSTG